MKINKLKIVYDNVIGIDDEAALVIKDNNIYLADGDIVYNQPYKKYGVMAEGICLLHTGKQRPLSLNSRIYYDADSYDLYLKGQMWYDISARQAILLIKNNVSLNDIQDKYNRLTNDGIAIKKSNEYKNFIIVSFKAGEYKEVAKVAYNTDGKELFSFESGIVSDGMKVGTNGIVLRLWKDYGNIELLEAMNKVKYPELLKNSEIFSYVIINTEGEFIYTNEEPAVVGDKFILGHNELVELHGNRLGIKLTARGDLKKARMCRIRRSRFCVATNDQTDKSKIRDCIVIDTDDMSMIHDVDVYRFNRTEFNCLGIVGESYTGILRLSDGKLFKVNEKCKVGVNGANISVVDKDKQRFIQILTDENNEYLYNGESIKRVERVIKKQRLKNKGGD